MRIRVDPLDFSEQRKGYSLRFCCEDCSFFHPSVDRCAHGWPTADHRKALYQQPQTDEVVFCKEFELA